MSSFQRQIPPALPRSDPQSDTNLRSEKQFSNEVRRETTHVGLVPVNAGWYERR